MERKKIMTWMLIWFNMSIATLNATRNRITFNNQREREKKKKLNHINLKYIKEYKNLST